MYRLLLALALGLVGAGIVHIVVLLLMPGYSVDNAWTRVSAMAAPFESVRLSEHPRDMPSLLSNPFIQAAGCRIDISGGPVRVRAYGRVPFWSISIYDRDGYNTFSINNDAARSRTPDFVLHASQQMQQSGVRPPDKLEESVLVGVDHEDGILLVRALVPDETWQGLAENFLNSLTCQPVDLPRTPTMPEVEDVPLLQSSTSGNEIPIPQPRPLR